MESNSFDGLKADLVSLGFAFNGEPSKIPPDPEKTLALVMKLFREDQKLYRILLSWLDRFGDLIHVERIDFFLNDLSDEEKLFLGVTALKRLNSGDYRFKAIATKIKKLKIKIESPLSGQDEFLISKYGEDVEFLSFGIRTSKIEAAESKKLMQRKWVIESNLWLRLRALLGSNFRADIAFVKIMKLAKNPYGSMKLIRCSKETTYRIWHSLEEANLESLFPTPFVA